MSPLTWLFARYHTLCIRDLHAQRAFQEPVEDVLIGHPGAVLFLPVGQRVHVSSLGLPPEAALQALQQ